MLNVGINVCKVPEADIGLRKRTVPVAHEVRNASPA
jgi:hypothetical protein